MITNVDQLIEELHTFYGETLDKSVIDLIVRENASSDEKTIFQILSSISGILFVRETAQHRHEISNTINSKISEKPVEKPLSIPNAKQSFNQKSTNSQMDIDVSCSNATEDQKRGNSAFHVNSSYQPPHSSQVPVINSHIKSEHQGQPKVQISDNNRQSNQMDVEKSSFPFVANPSHPQVAQYQKLKSFMEQDTDNQVDQKIVQNTAHRPNMKPNMKSNVWIDLTSSFDDDLPSIPSISSSESNESKSLRESLRTSSSLWNSNGQFAFVPVPPNSLTSSLYDSIPVSGYPVSPLNLSSSSNIFKKEENFETSSTKGENNDGSCTMDTDQNINDVDMITPGNPDEDVKIDEDALDFLGIMFPDFDPSYLALCLKSLKNDIEKVADFLLPVEMESVIVDEDDCIIISDEEDDGFVELISDYQHPIQMNESGWEKIPDGLLYDSLHKTPEKGGNLLNISQPRSHQKSYPVEEEEEDYDDDDDDDDEGFEFDKSKYAQDALFDSNLRELQEFFPTVDRDELMWVLIEHENDLSAAADAKAAEIRAAELDALNGVTRPQKGQGRRNRRNRRRARKNQQQAGKKFLPVSPVNAWVKPLQQQASNQNQDQNTLNRSELAPLIPLDLVQQQNISQKLQNSAVPNQKPVVVKAPRPEINSNANKHTALLPGIGLRPNTGLNRRPELNTDQDWYALLTTANNIYASTDTSRKAAVSAFVRDRKHAFKLAHQVRSSEDSWMEPLAQAAKIFYLTGARQVDLHGIRLRPASTLVRLLIKFHFELGDSPHDFFIITGRGNHSPNGISPIKEDVKAQLSRFRHIWVNPGNVKVFLPHPSNQ